MLVPTQEGLRIALDLVYKDSGKSHVTRRTRELGRQGERLREDVEVVHEEIRTWVNSGRSVNSCTFTDLGR